MPSHCFLPSQRLGSQFSLTVANSLVSTCVSQSFLFLLYHSCDLAAVTLWRRQLTDKIYCSRGRRVHHNRVSIRHGSRNNSDPTPWTTSKLVLVIGFETSKPTSNDLLLVTYLNSTQLGIKYSNVWTYRGHSQNATNIKVKFKGKSQFC